MADGISCREQSTVLKWNPSTPVWTLMKRNESERHLPVVEQTLAQLAGAQVFTKLEANSGFWQIPLPTDSSWLRTFLTPFGRYCLNRLPFGITSAPKHFQRRMYALLDGIEGVVCMMDMSWYMGKTRTNTKIVQVLQRLERARLTFNKEKCKFSQRQVKFLGQMVNRMGVQCGIPSATGHSVLTIRRRLKSRVSLCQATSCLATLTDNNE